MKFSTDVGSLVKALRAIARKHPARARRDVELTITATADGVVFETNLCTAFVPAHVAIAGACIAPRNAVTRVLATFVTTQPLTIEAAGDGLHIGRLRIPLTVSIRSRENDAYRPRSGDAEL